jgi:ATP-dependent DNA helicase RecG
MQLQTPIADAGRSFKMYAKKLEKLGIFTLEDLLYYIPFRYDNFSLISKIGEIQPGEVVTIQGTVLEIKNIFTKNYKKIQQAILMDETGSIHLTWFNQPFLTKYIHQNDTLSVSGRVDNFGNKLTIQSPEYEILGSNPPLHTGRLVPIYHETAGVSSKWLRRQIYTKLLELKDEVIEFLPDTVLRERGFSGRFDALQQIHFPQTLDEATRARERLAFDELLILQLRSRKRKEAWEQELHGIPFVIDTHAQAIAALITSLPFTLTTAQHRAIQEISIDLSRDKPMNRLLQGDVGSGKTVVAAIAMYTAFLNKHQSVLMAPTEILANQHFSSIQKLLSPFGVKVGLVTGSKKERTETDDILIGTHAVLHESITFTNLGLVIIDEQQRFGVAQRSIIRQKGDNPHVLTMTATPIPRTVALTMYGDLALSYLDEMPKDRKRIKTWLVPTEKRDAAYGWIKKQMQEHATQAFIICPFIEESENMQTVKAATVEYERLRTSVFPDMKLGLLHGKLKAKEKQQVLLDFNEKQFDMLVATPVVEVGIDIPNSTIILIEAAERFGLAQLHQLRGRVGRGDKQSYCLLFTEATNDTTIQRLKAMETSHVGAQLAELDLQLRGPGDMFGTAQHGLPKLKVANFSDFTLIEKAKQTADAVFPVLSHYPLLEKSVDSVIQENVSPD